jgi:uncharacterized protein
MNTTALILPGIGDSDPEHWQSLWQQSPSFIRVQQRDWDHPVCSEWVDVLEKSVAQAGERVVLIAHSLGCLLVAHWAAQTKLKVKGALLVAPPSPTAAPSATIFATSASGFLPIPMQPFHFPSIVVASANDPYSDLDFTQSCAAAWGSRFINIGAVGHINTSSGVGEWRAGFALFQKLAA